MLVLKRIRVYYRVRVPGDKRAEAERAHAVHHRACPVARSIGGSIDIQTELELVWARRQPRHSFETRLRVERNCAATAQSRAWWSWDR